MLQKKKSEGEKTVAVCMVHKPVPPPILYFMLSGGLGKLRKV